MFHISYLFLLEKQISKFWPTFKFKINKGKIVRKDKSDILVGLTMKEIIYGKTNQIIKEIEPMLSENTLWRSFGKGRITKEFSIKQLKEKGLVKSIPSYQAYKLTELLSRSYN